MRSILHAIRIPALLCFAAAACGAEGESLDESRQPVHGAPNPASQATFDVEELTAETCAPTRCFEVTSSKDISFIAVDANCPSASDIELSLYTRVNGDLVPVNNTPAPHGQGRACARTGVEIPADALKFDGLSQPSYVVCVEFEGVSEAGNVVIYAKAGTSCVEENLNSCDCEPNGEGGHGGEGGKGGHGGEGGKGGHGGEGGDGGHGGDVIKAPKDC